MFRAEMENRYSTEYPHRESPLENLRMIRGEGMDAFLEQERQQWTCPNAADRFQSTTGIVRIAAGESRRNEDQADS